YAIKNISKAQISMTSIVHSVLSSCNNTHALGLYDVNMLHVGKFMSIALRGLDYLTMEDQGQ
ncbi:hypothetical protein L9F63_005544, partial [Diploptera punctata]